MFKIDNQIFTSRWFPPPSKKFRASARAFSSTLKFHDIPNTRCRRPCFLPQRVTGVQLVNVHALGGQSHA